MMTRLARERASAQLQWPSTTEPPFQLTPGLEQVTSAIGWQS